MLNILVYEIPSIVAALHAGFFRRAGVRVTVCQTAHELLARAAIMTPQVVILPGSVLDPLQQRKTVLELRRRMGSGLRLLILAVSAKEPSVRELGLFDEVVAIDAPELDLARLLSPLLSPVPRCAQRAQVRLPVMVDDAGGTIAGIALDLSAVGARLLLERAPSPDQPLELDFHRADGRSSRLYARAVWSDARTPGAVRTGVMFSGVGAATLAALADMVLWEVCVEAGDLVIHLRGELEASTDLAPVLAQISRAPFFDVSEVRAISPGGLARWIELLRRIPPDAQPRFRGVPSAMFASVALLTELQRFEIESFWVPHVCPSCDIVLEELVELRARAMTHLCPICGDEIFAAAPRQWSPGSRSRASR